MENGHISYPWPQAPLPSEAVEVAPGVLWLRLGLPWALDHVNVYALDEGDSWTLVDTGIYSRRSLAHWQDLLEKGPLAGKPVSRLIVTHHHADHIGMAGWFQAQGAQLFMTRTAWLYARMLHLDVETSHSAETLLFWRRAGMPEASVTRRLAEAPWNSASVVHALPLGFQRLTEGATIRMGGRDWTIRLGSGHAPDHATFWTEGLVIGGDQLLPGISPNIGVYPAEPEADPLGEWLASCQRLAGYATKDQLVLPGHKMPFKGLPMRLSQLYDNHVKALDRLVAFLEQPRTAFECFPQLFRRPIDPTNEGLAMAESMAHLNHLMHEGRVLRQIGETGAYSWQARS